MRHVGSLGAALCSAAVAALLSAAPADAAKTTTCYRSAVPPLAAAAHTRSADIAITHSVGSNGMPQCTFAPKGRGSRLSITINVDNGPQAAFRLARTQEEATQIFGKPPPGWHAPIGQPELGPNAAWFPELGSLMALSHNSVDLVTVHVRWPAATRSARIQLARRMIAPFLR